MSEKEKKALEVIKEAIPKMSEFEMGYILGMGEAMANRKNEAAEEKKVG